MSLTTEQARAILSKVTVMSEGLFQETASRNAGKMVCKTFYCDVEGDDYNVLINGDKVIEINNSATKWPQAVIDNILNPPVREEAPNIPQFSGGIATPTQTPQFNTLPTNQPNIAGYQAFIQDMKQYLVDFIIANPGCVYSLFDPSNPNCVPEAAAAVITAWDFESITDEQTDEFAISFRATGCTDQAIADQVTAVLLYDTKVNAVTSVMVEG